MGNCVLCGQPAGWFRTEHAECRRVELNRREEQRIAAINYRRKLVADVSSTIAGGGDLVALEQRLAEELESERITLSERGAVVAEGWREAAAKLLDDSLLTEEEEERLALAKDRFILGPAQLDVDGMLTKVGKAAILRRVMSGEPTATVEIQPGFPINVQKGEQAAWCFHDVDYYEDRTRRQMVGGSQGMSVRLMKGVYYRVGAFKGEPVYSTSREKVDRGILLVTDKHLYFHGAAKSLRIPFKKVVSFTPYSDGIGVMRDAQTAKPQTFATGDGWFTYNLVTNLAQLGE